MATLEDRLEALEKESQATRLGLFSHWPMPPMPEPGSWDWHNMKRNEERILKQREDARIAAERAAEERAAEDCRRAEDLRLRHEAWENNAPQRATAQAELDQIEAQRDALSERMRELILIIGEEPR